MTDLNLSCRTCVFWVRPRGRAIFAPISDEMPGTGEMAQCRRMAPVNHQTEKGLRAFWPMTFGDTHWCGEHAVREAQS